LLLLLLLLARVETSRLLLLPGRRLLLHGRFGVPQVGL
jgi:hypothetical protein